MVFMLYTICICGLFFYLYIVTSFIPYLTPMHGKWIRIYFTHAVGTQFVCLCAYFHVSHLPSFLCPPPPSQEQLHTNISALQSAASPQRVLFLLPNAMNACTEDVVCSLFRDTVPSISLYH